MSDSERPLVKPQVLLPVHKICECNVTAPTISVANINVSGKTTPRTHVQWFGKANNPLPETSQFLFDVLRKPDNLIWMGHPEAFKVAFLGQIRNWPEPEAIRGICNMLKCKDETWIIWLCSHHCHKEYNDGYTGPLSFVSRIAILGDPNVGVITPQQYIDLGIPKCSSDCPPVEQQKRR